MAATNCRRRKTIERKSFGILGLFLVSTALADAATLTVDLNGGADHTGIQAAIDAAADGDTVLVRPGEYAVAEPISFKGKAIAVRSESGLRSV